MHPFPLIEALWASLDPKQPSGDDPARVCLALQKFYTDLHRAYLQGRRNRWKTDLFKAHDPKLTANLEQVKELTGQLAANFKSDSPLLDELQTLDVEIRKSIWELEQEEKAFALKPNESPKLMQLNYLFEGWSRGLLGVESLENFLGQFLKEAASTRSEIANALKTAKSRERESAEETTAIENATSGVNELELNIKNLLVNLNRGAKFCLPLREAILNYGQQLATSYHKLEQVAPVSEPCPFCGGDIALSGRCRSCGRRLPHLEEIHVENEGAQTAAIESPFITNNLRGVDLALRAFEDDPDSEELWKSFQESVRNFGKQVDASKQHLEMIANAPDRPIDPASAERLAEEELAELSALFLSAQRSLAQFAFQPFPPEGDLPEGWREPLIAAEPKLQALEGKWSPPESKEEPETELA